LFSPAGVALSSDPQGFVGETSRVQGLAVDKFNSLWMASNGNGRVVVFLSGDPKEPRWSEVPSGYYPFDVAIAADGSAWVTSSTGLYEYTEGNISRYSLIPTPGVFYLLSRNFSQPLGRGLKGLSIDSLGNIWVASGGEDAVCLLDSSGTEINKFRGGGVNGPWGTTIDGDDNVWVANFGQMTPGANYTNGAISKLKGANASTPPFGFKTGDPISPPSGYTLPSAGSPVLLANGEPLYGFGKEPCYSPLMRQTNLTIDQAGNVWACNNWKPDFDTNVSTETGNPGGDGVVIFVGLAKPPATQRVPSS
jgi:sugar lactone lactonase YvrE